MAKSKKKPKKAKKQAKPKKTKSRKKQSSSKSSKKTEQVKKPNPQQAGAQKAGKGEGRKTSIQSEIYALFERKGCDNVMVEEATLIARSVKPDTKFDRWHLYFHRKNWRRILVERAIARRKEMLLKQQRGN